MDQGSDKIVRTDEWVPIMLEHMKSGTKLKIDPIGISMYPFIITGRDSVVLKLQEENLKKGDICLYRRSNGVHVLHRIHHINPSGIYMLGDSQTWIEGPLTQDQILAVADRIIRKGKEIPCANKRYRCLARFWMQIRIVRPLCIQLWLWFRKVSGEEAQERKAYLESKKHKGDE